MADGITSRDQDRYQALVLFQAGWRSVTSEGSVVEAVPVEVIAADLRQPRLPRPVRSPVPRPEAPTARSPLRPTRGCPTKAAAGVGG
jgi:hypothetical protein